MARKVTRDLTRGFLPYVKLSKGWLIHQRLARLTQFTCSLFEISFQASSRAHSRNAGLVHPTRRCLKRMDELHRFGLLFKPVRDSRCALTEFLAMFSLHSSSFLQFHARTLPSSSFVLSYQAFLSGRVFTGMTVMSPEYHSLAFVLQF